MGYCSHQRKGVSKPLSPPVLSLPATQKVTGTMMVKQRFMCLSIFENNTSNKARMDVDL